LSPRADAAPAQQANANGERGCVAAYAPHGLRGHFLPPRTRYFPFSRLLHVLAACAGESFHASYYVIASRCEHAESRGVPVTSSRDAAGAVPDVALVYVVNGVRRVYAEPVVLCSYDASSVKRVACALAPVMELLDSGNVHDLVVRSCETSFAKACSLLSDVPAAVFDVVRLSYATTVYIDVNVPLLLLGGMPPPGAPAPRDVDNGGAGGGAGTRAAAARDTQPYLPKFQDMDQLQAAIGTVVSSPNMEMLFDLLPDGHDTSM
jgi:hypothetical protein